MDGRWKRLLAGTLLFGAFGCGHFRDKSHKAPSMGTAEPPLVMNDKPVIEDRRANKNEGPIKIETLIALGGVRVQAAADESRSTPEREDLANQARLVYKQVLARDPRNLDAMIGMARMYAVVRDKDKCVEWYQRATQAHPSKGEIWYEMGRTLGGTFKEKDAAITCLHTATKLTPDNRTYRTELGFTLAWAGRYEESRAWLSRTMPEAKARYNLAGIMEHNGQTEMAKRELAMAIQADPTHEPSRNMIAALTGQRERPTENSLQTASHDQWSTLPVNPSPKIPTDASIPQRHSNPPAAIQAPEPMPLNINRPNSVTPPLLPSSGWDR